VSVPVAAPARRSTQRFKAALATGLLGALILSASLAGTARAASTLNVDVGVGSGTVAGNVYAPGEVTVLVGDSVKFTIASDEPHTVTIGNGPVGVPPPNWPLSGFTGTVPPPPATGALTATYNGTGFLNTEVIFKGTTATVTYTSPGAFGFTCAIHPGMAGTVNVVASGVATTQAEADSKAAATRSAILGAVDGLEQATTAQVTETKRSDGTSRWDIFTNSVQAPAPQPGGGTGFLELMRFVPPSLSIGAGDTVKWTATAPHTVTFPAAGQDPTTIDPFSTPATTKTVYDGTSFFHSALLATGAPGVPSTFALTFPSPGTFSYVCALHQFLGQTGQIVVAAAPTVTPPPTDTGPLPAQAPSGSPPWATFGLLALAGLVVGAGGLRLRRR
jgi:plastocyanin